MSKRFLLLLGFAGFVNLVFAAAEPGVLVVPVRYTLIQFGMDIVSLRPVRLVAYDVKGEGGATNIFLWNTTTRAWDRLDAGRYSSGLVATKVPVVVVRDQDGMPEVFESAPVWSSGVKQLDSPDLARLANMMNDSLRFNAGEWGWLARRYGIKTADMNEERRRYGRYGKPGRGPLKPEPPSAEKGPVTPMPDAKTAKEEPAAVPDEAGKTEPEAVPPEDRVEERFEKGDAAGIPDVKPPEAEAGKAKEPAAGKAQETSLEDVPAVEPGSGTGPQPSGKKDAAPSADADAAKAAAVLDAGSAAKPEIKTPDAPLAMDK
jgi:hypothetical protein